MATERRKNPRFSVRDNAFAILRADPLKPVPIIDISLGGLGIAVDRIKMSPDGLNNTERLEILIDDCSFFMENLSYQLLPQYRNFSQNPVGSFQNVYGLKFMNLMPSQQARLKYFIRNHTRGGMTPKFMRKLNPLLSQFKSKKNFGDTCRNLWLQRPSM